MSHQHGRNGKVARNMPDAVDVQAGRQLRLKRCMMGLSQSELGEKVGVTFQQIQKYERGVNRMSASRLHKICEVLGVTVGYFFENATDAKRHGVSGLAEGKQTTLEGMPSARGKKSGASDDPASREILDLLRAYRRIRDRKKRRAVCDFVKSMADDGT